MDGLHIVTVATESKLYFPYLVESCKKNGKELEVLGMGETWQGFNWRYTKIIEYLTTLPDNDIVCFVDGYDVLCCRNLQELPYIFTQIREQTGCKIVVANEIGSMFSYFFSNIYFDKNNNNYINSGTYIGYVFDLLEILPQIYKLNPRNDADDQILMQQYCQKNADIIYCDIENKLFLTLVYPLEEFSKYVTINNSSQLITYNSENPFFIHAANNGFLNGIITKLGYTIDDNAFKYEIFINTVTKPIYYIKEFIIMHIMSVFLFLILLLTLYLVQYTVRIMRSKRIYPFWRHNRLITLYL